MNKIKKLKQLYNNRSKHSNYQILPPKLAEMLPADLSIKSRYEKERLDYFLKHIEIKDKRILDVGGNTGYFSFELLEKGAKHVHYYEGNQEHADFVKLASEVLGFTDKITITNEYLDFNNELKIKYDIILLLNVLHHVGDDYGDSELTIENAKKQILSQLNSLRSIADLLIFQLGFNWKGNRNLCLFNNGTKKEIIDFIINGTKGAYDIESIGIAEKAGSYMAFNELNNRNIERNDSLGEFLNRPIFILKKKDIL